MREARQSLERALAVDKEDRLARLYLGLALLGSGDHLRGLPELRTGLQSLHDWLEHIVSSRTFELYWDPDRRIRSEILKTLEMAGDRDVDAVRLCAAADWVGQEFEEEIERARRDERR